MSNDQQKRPYVKPTIISEEQSEKKLLDTASCGWVGVTEGEIGCTLSDTQG